MRDYGENQLNLPNLHKYYVDFPGLIITLIPHSDVCNQTWRGFYILRSAAHQASNIYRCRFGFATEFFKPQKLNQKFLFEIQHLKQIVDIYFIVLQKFYYEMSPTFIFRYYSSMLGGNCCCENTTRDFLYIKHSPSSAFE